MAVVIGSVAFVCVCLCVCPVCAIASESVDRETSFFLVYRHIFSMSMSISYVKLIGLKSKSENRGIQA